MAVLNELVTRHFGESAELRVFGSRLNDEAKGGDIDLHVVAPKSEFRNELSFLADVERTLDERVDLRVQRDEALFIDQVARKNGVVLNGSR